MGELVPLRAPPTQTQIRTCAPSSAPQVGPRNCCGTPVTRDPGLEPWPRRASPLLPTRPALAQDGASQTNVNVTRAGQDLSIEPFPGRGDFAWAGLPSPAARPLDVGAPSVHGASFQRPPEPSRCSELVCYGGRPEITPEITLPHSSDAINRWPSNHGPLILEAAQDQHPALAQEVPEDQHLVQDHPEAVYKGLYPLPDAMRQRLDTSIHRFVQEIYSCLSIPTR